MSLHRSFTLTMLKRDRIHAQLPYADKGQGAIKNNQDGIFRRGGGEQLLLQLTSIGTFDIGKCDRLNIGFAQK